VNNCKNVLHSPQKTSAVLLQAVPNVLISIHKTRYILAKSNKKKFSAVRMTTLHEGNVGDVLVKGTFQDGLQKTVWSNLNSNGIMGNLLCCLVKIHCIK